MKIVIDTNVLISGVFFSGAPRKVLNAVIDLDVEAFASPEIIEEYQEIIDRMIERKQGNINRSIISPLLQRFSIITPVQVATECRDPDDNKFLDCARDSGDLFIVSGDKDLLVLENYEEIDIITAKDFCETYLKAGLADAQK